MENLKANAPGAIGLLTTFLCAYKSVDYMGIGPADQSGVVFFAIMSVAAGLTVTSFISQISTMF